jgi:hypothetical protein
VNAAYKHLDARLRIADLTIPQWLGILGGVLLAIVWAQYVSPFGDYVTLFTAVYVGALPVGAALYAGLTEFDLVLFVRSALRWRRMPGRYVAGPGTAALGYVVLADPAAFAPEHNGARDIDLARLWDS